MTVHTRRRIIITGFMAAGKTTVARALARQLDCQMIDLDETIAEREKRTVATLIRDEGETNFRESETLMLRIVLENKTWRIIALGGGAWTLERNRALIAEHDCLTVWLDAPFELCWKRITSEKATRPLALDRKRAHQLYEQRRPLYELAAAHVRVESKSEDEIALEIISALQGQPFLEG
jgi:shikimate kinase